MPEFAIDGVFCDEQYAYAKYRKILSVTYYFNFKTGDILYAIIICTFVYFRTVGDLYDTAGIRYSCLYTGDVDS